MRRPVLLLAALTVSPLIMSSAWGQSFSERLSHLSQRQAEQTTRGRTGKPQMLGALLYTDLTVEFDETNAREAIRYLSNVLGINIVSRFRDDRNMEGIDPETPITFRATGTPALTVLEMILDQCSVDGESCTWQLRDGYVEVGTKSRLAVPGSQELRYYPVRDLLFEVPYFDNAPQLDLGSALDQGGSGGGGGGGGGRGGGGRGGGGSGGGGRGGGGGGAGGGGGGGGSLFGTPSGEPQRITEDEHADTLISLLMDTVEPEGWVLRGGTYATIRYYQGVLIIKAPDFVHRQIGGYPFAARPSTRRADAGTPSRYVTFTGGFSEVQLIDLANSDPFSGAAGGGGSGGAGGGGSGGSGGGGRP